MLFLIFTVFVDTAAGVWGLSDEERRQFVLFNTGVGCVCGYVLDKPCLLKHYRHYLLLCLAVPPVISFYIRTQSPFSVSDNASANFG